MTKCKTCGHELNDTLIIDGWEYETEDHDFDKELKDIQIPKGWELWTIQDCIKLHNSHKKELNLEDCWFYIKQEFKLNVEKDYVAGFYANSDWANLNCGGVPSDTGSSLGVRFKRKVRK